jgi:hypothetical protein
VVAVSAARRVAVACSAAVSVAAGSALALVGGVPGGVAASVLVPVAAVAAGVWAVRSGDRRSGDGSRWSVRAEPGADAEGLSVVVCESCGLFGAMGHSSPDARALAMVHDRMHHGTAPTATTTPAPVAVPAVAGSPNKGWDCESCRRYPAVELVVFADGGRFGVCGACAPGASWGRARLALAGGRS